MASTIARDGAVVGLTCKQRRAHGPPHGGAARGGRRDRVALDRGTGNGISGHPKRYRSCVHAHEAPLPTHAITMTSKSDPIDQMPASTAAIVAEIPRRPA